ncbi:MAG: hypothetical protein K2Q26_10240 [Bdellovibrionales bacterium]|nr:hypothetical protein [Bdellovibrionales bacterium]
MNNQIDQFGLKFLTDDSTYGDYIRFCRIKLIKKGPPPPIVYVTYQYHVVDIRGVDTSKIGIAHEDEVVSEKIPARHVVQYREVYLIFNGGVLGSAENLKLWREKRRLQNNYLHLLRRFQSEMTIEFSPWIKF